MKHLKLGSTTIWSHDLDYQLETGKKNQNVLRIHFNLSKITVKKGYLPEAVFNFIALLVVESGGENEIFSREKSDQLL